jgi:hypothetical protein
MLAAYSRILVVDVPRFHSTVLSRPQVFLYPFILPFLKILSQMATWHVDLLPPAFKMVVSTSSIMYLLNYIQGQKVKEIEWNVSPAFLF